MRLIEVRVRKYRNIIDSGPVSVQPDVTCLVGKNESGKTAFLQALHRLHPDRPTATFSVASQYPAWLEQRDRLRGDRLEGVKPVLAWFDLDPRDLQVVEAALGSGVLRSTRVGAERDYNGNLTWSVEADEAAFVTHLLREVQLPENARVKAGQVASLNGLRAFIQELRAGKTEHQEAGDDLESQLTQALGSRDLIYAVGNVLEPLLPRFMCFSEYSKLPYSVDIRRVLTADPSQLGEGELTARSLLKLAAATDEYLTSPDYERRKRELENVANMITDDVLHYWSQNPELRVQPDVTQRVDTTSSGGQSILDELKIRVWDQRHSLSLPLDEHSSGFRWFFSFLAAFSQYEHSADGLVLLLDEPALGLHARAQRDFLRFIDERLAARCQVIYTTHSPFMIEPDKLERVRLVEDRGNEPGSKVTSDVMCNDPDTLFPLRGALGYDLVQHLFDSPHNLVVESTSDFTFLTVLSDHLGTRERTALDERWTVIPVGGADLVPAFVSLIGTNSEITVLVDSRRDGYRRLARLATDGLLEANRIISVGQVIGSRMAGIEDVFEVGDYLALYNRAFQKSWMISDLNGNGPIVDQLAQLDGVERFDRFRPADELLRHRDEILPQLSTVTLDRFEALLTVLNGTLSG